MGRDLTVSGPVEGCCSSQAWEPASRGAPRRRSVLHRVLHSRLLATCGVVLRRGVENRGSRGRKSSVSGGYSGARARFLCKTPVSQTNELEEGLASWHSCGRMNRGGLGCCRASHCCSGQVCSGSGAEDGMQHRGLGQHINLNCKGRKTRRGRVLHLLAMFTVGNVQRLSSASCTDESCRDDSRPSMRRTLK